MDERNWRALEYRSKVRRRKQIRRRKRIDTMVDVVCGLICALAIFGLSAYCTYLWLTYQVV